MYGFLKKRVAQTVFILTVSFFSVSVVWSASESQSEILLTLESWAFQVQSVNYLVGFTINLTNGYERSIEKIDAFLYFVDQSGNHVEKAYINPYIKLQPGESRQNSWTYIMNPFSPMLKMRPSDVRARLVVRGLKFSTGEELAFTIGNGVIY
jgi:hypothetical protein